MMRPVDEFGKLLMEHVRDDAIHEMDNQLLLRGKNSWAERMKAARDTDPEFFLKMVVMDTVDETIFRLLLAIGNEHIKLSFETENGTVHKLTGDGELHGWPMGKEGWIAEFSKERFIDDFAD
ncbi:hypothetical protein CJD36_021655 [Flavipsychrobacter stenotrophus]|uniref:Uncharacterized protein n=1 Tax=Flavipsychrobacter stenotrophus TaxID=2077091 RepID=A0A2S7SPQ5_9BACT|nr:hypothetical protein [Flavipsychrobacter stenotrophus]PQJ08879.1 hypothetical protein CJD36_021655 [Flavipsychrobacter stenotrophus]